MPRFSANIGFLWPERSLTDRIRAAKSAGFSAVECHWPYDTNPAEVRDVLRQTGLQMLALNTDTGDLEAGEYGFGAVPGRQADARASVDKAISYAKVAGIKNIHLMAGTAGDSNEVMAIYHDNLVYASQQAAAHRIGVIIEPINRIDRPGYTLHTIGQAISVIEKLHAAGEGENVRIMFDCYHVQTTEGFLAERLKLALPHLVHIQIAAVPGRAEPDQGEINYPWLYQYIDSLGYDGFIGAEYIPATTTDEGLGWYQPYGNSGNQQSPDNVVYKNLNQEKLDAEYNNLQKVTDSQSHLDWFCSRSKEVRSSTVQICDIAFGQHAEETLDIFYPDGKTDSDRKRPVHVFFHGGYWRALHKDDFSFVSNALKGSDAICIVVNYALVPQVTLDQLVAQCRNAMLWTWNHVEEYGGDQNNITISGHSAGGQLVGMMMASDWPRLDHHCPGNLVKAGVSISGLFDMEPIRLCFLNETLGLDAAEDKRNSPVHLNNKNRGELVCYYGSLEGEEYRWQSESLESRWTHARAECLTAHNHFTIVRELERPDSVISQTIRRQLGINK